MSYLDLPRVHLFGTFFATPSTINNVDSNYDPANPIKPLWNPRGQALWKLDTAVRTVVGDDGTPSPADPLVGARFTSVRTSADAKLVDLDPDMQFVSQVWGLQVRLTLADGTVALSGPVEVCALTDLWFGRVVNTTARGNTCASGAYQSVLRPTWGDTSSSPVLQALREASPDLLSIKWVVDGYNATFNTPSFGYGRMVATLGPATAAEPRHVLMGRRLEVSEDQQQPLLWFGTGQLRGTRLTLDLGNSVAVEGTPGGPPLAFASPITVAAAAPGGPVPLGTVDYSLAAYEGQAGIFDLALTAEQAAAAASSPLQLSAGVPTGMAGYTAALAERPDGRYVNVDRSFTRLEPGEHEAHVLYASVFGAPATVDVALEVTPVGPPADGFTFQAGPKPGSKTVPVTDGAGPFTVTAGSIGTPRPYIDGQVYLLSPPDWSTQLPAGMLNALVFSPYKPASTPPTWTDVGPILTAFARLYPGMRDIMDLSDYGTMKSNAGALQQVLSAPIGDPAYMPVTRDLSDAKRQAILDWIAAGCPAGAPPAASAESAESAGSTDAAVLAGAAPHEPVLPNAYHLE